MKKVGTGIHDFFPRYGHCTSDQVNILYTVLYGMRKHIFVPLFYLSTCTGTVLEAVDFHCQKISILRQLHKTNVLKDKKNSPK